MNEKYINLDHLFDYLAETFKKNAQFIMNVKNITSKTLRMTSIDYNLYL
jgi:ribosomal protein S17E